MKIKVNYATLPVTKLSLDYMCQVIEPKSLRTVPFEVSVIHNMTAPKETQPIEELKKILRKRFGQLNIKDVDLVECDLLVPKKAQEFAPGPGTLDSEAS